MLAATHCGLQTAEVFYEPLTQSCVVRRFDRSVRPDGTLERLPQYDLCQLAGVISEGKYESEGGPGAVRCAELIRRYSSQPALDLRSFVQWILFNLYTGNNDSHAKNLSMYRSPDRGFQLTPFYDLMCTRLYPGLSRSFAFAIDGETRPGSITRAHITHLAEQLRMQPRFVIQMALDLAQRLPDAIDQAIRTVTPSLSPDARKVIGRLRALVLSTTSKIAARLAE